MRRLQIPPAIRRASGRLGDGLPVVFVAALAALVLIAILYNIANKDPATPRSFAELTLSRSGCAVDPQRNVNAAFCTRVSSRVYRVAFTSTLATTVIGSRGSCCPGGLGVSVESPHTALVVVDHVPRTPIRASIFAP